MDSELFPELPAARAPRRPRNLAAPSMAPFVIVRSVCETPGSESIDCPEIAVKFWAESIATRPDFDPDKESLWVIVLNTKMKIKGVNMVSLGGINESLAPPSGIFRPVIALAGFSFVLMHNHPSGDPEPSSADSRITQRIKEGAQILALHFHDHVIYGSPTRFYSYRARGLI